MAYYLTTKEGHKITHNPIHDYEQALEMARTLLDRFHHVCVIDQDGNKLGSFKHIEQLDKEN